MIPAVLVQDHDHDDGRLKFIRVTFGQLVERERQRGRWGLEAYWGRDTDGMVWSIEKLQATLDL